MSKTHRFFTKARRRISSIFGKNSLYWLYSYQDTEEVNMEKRFTTKERSWILYDWANSVYATNIMAAIFPTIFVAFAGDQGDLALQFHGNFLIHDHSG